MTKVQQLVRRNTVLAVLALTLALFIALRPSQTSAVSVDDLPALLPDLVIDDARAIELSKSAVVMTAGAPADALRLVRPGEAGWEIASRSSYPADMSKVTAFLENLVGAKQKRVITERSDAFAAYAGPDGWTDVVVKDGAGKSLATLSIGKTARWPDAYVKVASGEKERILLAHNLRTDRASLDVSEWGESRLWPGLDIADVARIDVFQRGEKQTLSFGRKAPPAEPDEKESDGEDEATPDAPEGPKASEWVMRAPRPAEVESYRVENLVRSFTGMRLVDVAPLSIEPEADAVLGLAKPSYRVVLHIEPETEGGETRRRILLVGNEKLDAEGQGTEQWYVKREGDPWVFLVRTSAIADFRLPADDFLPKKEEKPAEEKPADEDTEEKPADEDTEEKPADEDTEERPAEDKPAEGSPDGDR